MTLLVPKRKKRYNNTLHTHRKKRRREGRQGYTADSGEEISGEALWSTKKTTMGSGGKALIRGKLPNTHSNRERGEHRG